MGEQAEAKRFAGRRNGFDDQRPCERRRADDIIDVDRDTEERPRAGSAGLRRGALEVARDAPYARAIAERKDAKRSILQRATVADQADRALLERVGRLLAALDRRDAREMYYAFHVVRIELQKALEDRACRDHRLAAQRIVMEEHFAQLEPHFPVVRV